MGRQDPEISLAPLPLLPISEQVPKAPGSQAMPLPFCCYLPGSDVAPWAEGSAVGVRRLVEMNSGSFSSLFQVLPVFLCLSIMGEQRQGSWLDALGGCLHRGNESPKGCNQPSCHVKCQKPHPDVAISNP